uniref:Cupin-like domain-containing protein n=1 Tax=Ciona savignyi TaxID=51511 RepID=H2Y5J6_CIOSA
MFSGWKETLLIDKVAGQTLFLGNEAAYTHLDVDRVDMYKYPALQNVTWHKMHVEPGDCYFVPYKWYQFENSSNTRNLAVSFWLTHQFRYEDDCQYPEKRKSWLSDVKMSSGDEQSRVEVLELFFGNETMTLDTFRHFFVENKTDNEETTTQEVSTKSRSRITKNWINDHKSNVIDKMFQKIDTNGDKLLSIEEVYNAELVYFTRLIGSLGEHYMEYETLQDGGGYETGKDILAQKKLKYMRNEL